MKLYCILTSRKKPYNTATFEYLKQAAQDRDLSFEVLEADTFDYSQDMTTAIETPCLLYRLSTTQQAAMLEALLVRRGVTTLHSDPQLIFTRGFPWNGALRLRATGLPIIPTIFNVTKDQEAHLEKYVAQLGGFPIILKASGGSHGNSVLRIDSIESLKSVLGFVTSSTNDTFVLRRFIHNATHIRMVVVGNDVADAIRYLPQPGDFRTNAVTVPRVVAFDRTAENAHLFDLAVRSVNALGLEFGGVDVLLDAEGNATIAEINFPCNFARNQMNTGVDVAGKIVDHLLAKAKSVAA